MNSNQITTKIVFVFLLLIAGAFQIHDWMAGSRSLQPWLGLTMETGKKEMLNFFFQAMAKSFGAVA